MKLPLWCKIIDWAMLRPLWNKYDDIKEPWRFLIAMLLGLPPIWIINIWATSKGNAVPLYVKIAATYLFYFMCSGTWKLINVNRERDLGC